MRENRISLSNEKDIYGRNKAIIEWQISEQDRRNIVRYSDKFITAWSKNSNFFSGLLPRTLDVSAIKAYDAYHPVGTCRMGEDSEAVVDSNLKVFGLENLFVISTAVLPSAGSANPTFTMLCLARRLSQLIHIKLNKAIATL